jgi:hypothetical protein
VSVAQDSFRASVVVQPGMRIGRGIAAAVQAYSSVGPLAWMQRGEGLVLSQVSNVIVDFGDLDKLGGQRPAGAKRTFRACGSRPTNSELT